jgi:hypothetical protein
MIFGTKASGEAPSRALVGPSVDFWLVGGGGIAIFLIFVAGTQLWPDYKWEYNTAVWAAGAAFAINFPHFAYSYLLFYPGFWARLTGTETTLFSRIRLVIAGIIVPIALIAFLAQAWRTQSAHLLTLAILSMILTVGWHYVKQGYGVLITLSVYKSVFYKEWEKRILYVNAYAVWIYTWCRTNGSTGVQTYYDITYNVTAYPDWIVRGTLAICAVTTALAGAVLLKHWLYDRKGISWAAVTGYACAIYMWVLLPYYNMAFYVFIPMFHSLQYLPFVYKYKVSEFNRAKAAPEGNPQRTYMRALAVLLLFAAGGVALGTLFFDTIPKYMDSHPSVNGSPLNALDLDPQFFVISFIVFINVHHFFIDSAFWRRDNTEVQRNLFRA